MPVTYRSEGFPFEIGTTLSVEHQLDAQRVKGTSRIVGAHRAPGGGPRVYRVDGSEVALRLETAAHLILRVAAGDSPRDVA